MPARQVSLSFYEKRKKQSGWAIIGGAQDERLYWEQWSAPADLIQPPTATVSCRSARPRLELLKIDCICCRAVRQEGIPSFGASM